MIPKNMPSWFVPALSAQELQLRERRFYEAFNNPPVVVGKAESRYAKYLRSPHWFQFRKCVLILANFRCVDCGGLANQVHHKTYVRIGRENFHDVEPVCDLCHGKRHPDKVGLNPKPPRR